MFFVVKGKLLLHGCKNEEAEKYGDFLNYPESHMLVWEKNYAKKYGVDFDFFPRGRVVYNLKEECYYIYHDGCIKDLSEILKLYDGVNFKICRDFHYQCFKCNKGYVV